MPPELISSLAVLGRILLGGLFVVGGITHFFALSPITEVVRAKGIPLPGPSLIAASLFQIVAGLSLVLGWFVPPAASGLILFTAVSSFVMLDFWNQVGEQRTATINVWLSNIAIIGGLMLAAAHAR